MATLRELKTRIGSVSSSEKITGAMKMISSAKVHKFESSLRQLLPYKNQIKSIMGHILAAGGDYSSPLIEERDIESVGVVVFGSDDGLCGAYNINIFKFLVSELAEIRRNFGDKVRISLFPIGSKMVKACRKISDPLISVKERENLNSKMSGEEVNSFTHELESAFLSGELDRVEVVYMHFFSMGRQRPAVEQIFPLSKEMFENDGNDGKEVQDNQMYIFEPDANSIFNTVLPMFVLSSMQEITIENRASEQAARVMAMQAANDNAKKLLESLTLEYNKLRQQSITTELLDILGGQVNH